MTKQSTNKKSSGAEKLGKGKITPFQVAFIVDRYLCDNNYNQTRSMFRSEASGLISGSTLQEAPKSLLSLGAMLDEYISLKEQRVLLNQERCRLEQDKLRVQNLLQGLQDAMNVFNAGAHLVSPPLASPNFTSIASTSGPIATTSELPIGSPVTGYQDPAILSRSNNGSITNPSGVLVPSENHSSLKRKASSKDGSYAPQPIKRHQKSSMTKNLNNSQAHSIGQPPCRALSVKSVPNLNASSGSGVEGQGVVKCLFTQQAQSHLPNASSSGPKTPPLPSSSQIEKSNSPLELHSSANQELTITSTKAIQVSPDKHISYYSITRNHQISTFSPLKPSPKRINTRDHVKGRLNFDVTDDQSNTDISSSDRNLSPEETDILNFDLSSFEALENMDLSALLIDFDIDSLESCQPNTDATPDSTFCYEAKSGDVHDENDGFMSHISSTVTQIVSDKETSSSGVDAVMTRKSVTKCIKMISPAKSKVRLMDQEPSIYG